MGEEGKWGGKGETAWYKGSCPANDGGLNYFWNSSHACMFSTCCAKFMPPRRSVRRGRGESA